MAPTPRVASSKVVGSRPAGLRGGVAMLELHVWWSSRKRTSQGRTLGPHSPLDYGLYRQGRRSYERSGQERRFLAQQASPRRTYRLPERHSLGLAIPPTSLQHMGLRVKHSVGRDLLVRLRLTKFLVYHQEKTCEGESDNPGDARSSRSNRRGTSASWSSSESSPRHAGRGRGIEGRRYWAEA
jgi:hypothetical protein